MIGFMQALSPVPRKLKPVNVCYKWSVFISLDITIFKKFYINNHIAFFSAAMYYEILTVFLDEKNKISITYKYLVCSRYYAKHFIFFL